MPAYDYRCLDCQYEWEEVHAATVDAHDCPACESTHIQRRIISAPTIAGGVMTHAGDGKRASQEQLRLKWAEETPKLRKRLRDKLGDKADNIPTLNHPYDE